MRALVRTIPRRAALAAFAGGRGILVLAIAAPGLADRHDAETLEAWLGSEARLAGDLARDGLRARDPNVLDPLAHRIATSAGVRVTFIDPTGVVLGESDEDRLTMEAPMYQRPLGISSSRTPRGGKGPPYPFIRCAAFSR